MRTPIWCRRMNRSTYITTFILWLLSSMKHSSTQTYETVFTPSGPIKGINVPVGSQNVVQFRSIPFAKSPVGELRFRKPVPRDRWTDILDATRYGPFCVQPLDYLPSAEGLSQETSISEDCLSLNLFIPEKVSLDSKKSVMIWIHGGGFLMGSGQMFNGSNLAIQSNVIVVTINYRLGALGFLSTEDSASPGNYGLWDQILAFKWVKSNIAAFGGDPGSITIFGESAGSISVSLQMLIPRNRGLFHRVIGQSGTASSPVTFMRNPLYTAKTYGKALKCIDTDSIDVDTFALIECMRSLPVEVILQAQKSQMLTVGGVKDWTLLPTLFPVIDGDLFKTNPLHELGDKESFVHSFYQSLDYLTGTTNFEGGVTSMLISAYQQELNFNISEGIPTRFLCDIMGPAIGKEVYNDKTVTGNILCDFYKSDDVEEQARQISNLYGDIVFYTSTIEMLDYHAMRNTKSKTFQYLFSKSSDSDFLFPMPKWGKGLSPHGEELLFIFGPTISDKYDARYSESSSRLFKRMIRYWTNFAKTGDPNGNDLPVWLQYTVGEKSYIDLDDDITQQSKLFARRMNLHLQVIPSMIQQKTEVIATAVGPVKGINIPIKSGNVLQFRNIPYAKPPIGYLRFRKPVAFGSWTKTLDATTFGPPCIQDASMGNVLPILVPDQEASEDCLSLNIYVPNAVDSTKKLSVMVWIHGGGFGIGQGPSYDGSLLALDGNVIVVTLNYRLGIFGFMSTEDAASPGNYGLWDQIMALKWIKSNIVTFGGNTNSITLFGESAGSFSATLQMMIPENRGLFHRVIGQSGSAAGYLAFNSYALKATNTVGEYLNCTRGSNHLDVTSFELVKCLRKKSVVDIMQAIRTVSFNLLHEKVHFCSDMFWPVLDADLFKGRNPVFALNNSESDVYAFFHSVDLMAGTVDREGQVFGFIFQDFQNKYKFNISEGLPKSFLLNEIAPAIGERIYNDQNVAVKVLSEFYGRDDPIQQGREIYNLLGEIIFDVPTVHILETHSRRNVLSSTYQYVFTKALNVDVLCPVPQWAKGKAGHFDDVNFLFGPHNQVHLFDPHLDTTTEKLSKQMIKYWTNFAKKGNPNGRNLPTWPEYDLEERSYINLGDNIIQEKNFLSERITLLQKSIPSQISKFTVLLNTPSGPMKGINIPVRSQNVLQFRNIPYAKPPLKSLRFRKTVPYGKWTKVLDATAFGPSCIQDTQTIEALYASFGKITTSEDCLSLNVYVPEAISTDKKKSVMVWFHGGGFSFGQGTIYDGSRMALEGNLIVVTINYRLGAFGFLTTGDSSAPGNYGLWDQRAALQWVKDNIEAFGGNADSITIFGGSAGSFSVTYHMMIPENRDLFHRAIAQSGAGTVNIKAFKEPHDMVKSVGKDVKCIEDTTSVISMVELIDCIRTVDANTILEVQKNYTYNVFSNLLTRTVFFPTLDDGELFRHGNPVTLLSDSKSAVSSFFRSIDFIGGTNSFDGSYGLKAVLGAQQSMGLSFNVSEGIPTSFLCDTFIPSIVDGFFKKDNTIIEKTLCDFYSRQDLKDQGKQLLDMYGDVVFNAPKVRLLNIHTNENTLSNTYQYLFSYDSGVPYLVPVYDWTTGAGHGDEVFYLFGPDGLARLVDVDKSANLEQLSKAMLKFWTNFAKTGDPNDDDLPLWSRYDSSEQRYLNLDLEIKEERRLYKDRMKLIIETVPKLQRKSKESKEKIEL